MLERMAALEDRNKSVEPSDFSDLTRKAAHLKERIKSGVIQVQKEVRSLGIAQKSGVMSFLITIR